MSEQNLLDLDLNGVSIHSLTILQAQVEMAIRAQRLKAALTTIHDRRSKNISLHAKVAFFEELLMREVRVGKRNAFIDEYLDNIECIL